MPTRFLDSEKDTKGVFRDFLSRATEFRSVPAILSGDMRPTWRIALLLISLSEACRGGAADLTVLQVINWALRQPEKWAEFERILKRDLPLFHPIVRFDPTLNRAIDFAAAHGVVEIEPHLKVRISTKGRAFVRQLKESEAAPFEEEILFLQRIKPSLTKVNLRRVLYGERR